MNLFPNIKYKQIISHQTDTFSFLLHIFLTNLIHSHTTLSLHTGDDNGQMSYEDFDVVLLEVFPELNLSKSDLTNLQQHYDKNLDQLIDVNEFRTALMQKVVPTTTTVTIEDPETGKPKDIEIDTAAIKDVSKSTAEKVREQRAGYEQMSLITGTLEIKMKRGDISHDTSGMMDSKMDPYVRLRYDHEKSWKSTKYAHNQHKFPVWTTKENNFFELIFDKTKNMTLKKPILQIECWDDKTGFDSEIGQGTFDLTRLLSGGIGSEIWREYKIEILHKGRTAGDIYVDMRYVTTDSKLELNAKKGEAKVQLIKDMKEAGIDENEADAIEHLVASEMKNGKNVEGNAEEVLIPPGMIGIMIKSGSDMYRPSMLDTPDPYVCIVPSWLPKQQSHRTSTKNDGGKNVTWNKKDAPFGHFRIEETMVPIMNVNDKDKKYTVRIEVVDDNIMSDTLMGTGKLEHLKNWGFLFLESFLFCCSVLSITSFLFLFFNLILTTLIFFHPIFFPFSIAVVDLKPWIEKVSTALVLARQIAVKKGEDPSDVKIISEALEDVKIPLVRENGKSAGELLIGIKFSHTPGASSADLKDGAFTNEASTGSVDQEKTIGTLSVTVMEAMNLKDSDWFGGESDPFVQLWLEPRASKESKQSYALESGETRIKNGAGRRARFDETFQMPVFRVATNSTSPGSPESPSRNAKGRERLANRRLRLTVKDKDPRFLGLGSEFVLKTFSKIERILNIVLLVLIVVNYRSNSFFYSVHFFLFLIVSSF